MELLSVVLGGKRRHFGLGELELELGDVGAAPDYLKIAGRWQENRLFQVTFPEAERDH